MIGEEQGYRMFSASSSPFRRAIGRSISLGSSHSSMDLLGSVDGVTFLLGIGTISRT